MQCAIDRQTDREAAPPSQEEKGKAETIMKVIKYRERFLHYESQREVSGKKIANKDVAGGVAVC